MRYRALVDLAHEPESSPDVQAARRGSTPANGCQMPWTVARERGCIHPATPLCMNVQFVVLKLYLS